MNIFLFLFLANFILLLFYKKFSKILNIYDYPDGKRKLHPQKTPLLGGFFLGINIALFCIFKIFNFTNIEISSVIFIEDIQIVTFFVFSFLIFLIGILDDKIEIRANTKFILLFITIIILVNIENDLVIKSIKLSFSQKEIFLLDFSKPFTILCFLLFINACNMFDGINLQLPFYALLTVTSFFFIINFLEFFLFFLIFPLVTISALNLKGKIFMGDSGSLLIAFVLSYLSIKLYNLSYFQNSDSIFLFMMIPGIDMLRLFFQRLLNKKNPFLPDRKHLHHLISDSLNTALTRVILFSILSVPPLMFFFEMPNILTVIIVLLAYTLLLFYLKKK